MRHQKDRRSEIAGGALGAKESKTAADAILIDDQADVWERDFSLLLKVETLHRQRELQRGQERRIARKNDDRAIWRHNPASFDQAAFFQLGSNVTWGGQSATGPTGKPASSLAKP